jgi:ABC-type uncharacterized transport system permease subunit
MDSPPSLLSAGLAILSALLYLLAVWRQVLNLETGEARQRQQIALVGAAALAAHALAAYLSAHAGESSLGFYRVASLMFLSMGVISLVALVARPLHTLLIVLFPLAALSILVATFAPDTSRPMSDLPAGILSHVSASIISFAVLALAVLQGLLVTVQSRQLRQHRSRGVIRKLPPLEAASALFYELTGAGFLILTVAIGTGMVFVDDLFGQHLVHKTVLTMLAWCLYAVLLFQYFRRGWRVQSAISLSTIAFGLVVLGFFGSKLVLELLLPLTQ